MLLALVIGLLLLIALSTMILGPHFGQWLASRMHLSRVWLWVWPYIHWMISVGFTVLAVETLYFLGPNVKQRFSHSAGSNSFGRLSGSGSLTCWAFIFEPSQTSTRPTEPWERVLL